MNQLNAVSVEDFHYFFFSDSKGNDFERFKVILISLLNGISIFVGCLVPKPSLQKGKNGNI